ncbi:MAG: hypothetical protein R3C11_28455 [Planctomycetaceae bacterium]
MSKKKDDFFLPDPSQENSGGRRTRFSLKKFGFGIAYGALGSSWST